jgi:hypothetical protein
VGVWNTKASREEWQWMAFLLPHEYTAALTKYGDLDILRSGLCLGLVSKNRLEKLQRRVGEDLMALDLWGDGAPGNYDRTESVGTFSLNIPGIKEPYHTHPLPITATSRKQVGPNTWALPTNRRPRRKRGTRRSKEPRREQDVRDDPEKRNISLLAQLVNFVLLTPFFHVNYYLKLNKNIMFYHPKISIS